MTNTLLVLSFCLISSIISQHVTIPQTWIGQTRPYEMPTYEPDGFSAIPQFYYNDPAHGQRIDYFYDPTDTVPYQSQLYLNNDMNYFLVYKLGNLKYASPFCIFLSGSVYPGALVIDANTPIGTGLVLNQTTLTYIDKYNTTWCEVTVDTQYMYPKSISTLQSSSFFTSFQVVTPDPSVWQLPACFAQWTPPSPPPVPPPSFPPAYSYGFVSVLKPNLLEIQMMKYVDTMKLMYREDYQIQYFPENLNLLISSISNNQYSYLIVDLPGLTPVPCTYYNASLPSSFNQTLNFYGSVLLTDDTTLNTFNIFSGASSGDFYAFDVTTNALKATYNFGSQIPITQYNPTEPDPSVFKTPTTCYPVQVNEADLPQAPRAPPSFPAAFTVKFLTYPQTSIWLYYNNMTGTPLWRIDTNNFTEIQNGNMLYAYNNPYTNSPSITPLPCVKGMVTLSPFQVLSIPSYFYTYLGSAVYNGQNAEVWSQNGVISYWVNDKPILILGVSYPIIIDYYQSGPPPTNLFVTPSSGCITISSNAATQNLRNRFAK